MKELKDWNQGSWVGGDELGGWRFGVGGDDQSWQ